MCICRPGCGLRTSYKDVLRPPTAHTPLCTSRMRSPSSCTRSRRWPMRTWLVEQPRGVVRRASYAVRASSYAVRVAPRRSRSSRWPREGRRRWLRQQSALVLALEH
eukprot:scaffold18601_cov63-Phaeocystis_antarctica.AAC.4